MPELPQLVPEKASPEHVFPELNPGAGVSVVWANKEDGSLIVSFYGQLWHATPVEFQQ